MTRRRVVILAKAPVPGRVKSRLAVSVGHRAAARYYRRMVSEVAAVAASASSPATPVSVGLYFTPRRHPFLDRLCAQYGLTQQAQPGGDLGARLSAIARQELRTADALLMIGGDCVGLTAGHLRQAFEQLHGGAEAVFAPAGDGGYTLVGLCAPKDRLFRRIPWGGPRVLASTARQAARGGLQVALLPSAADLDDLGDLKQWRRVAGPDVAWRSRPRGAYSRGGSKVTGVHGHAQDR